MLWQSRSSKQITHTMLIPFAESSAYTVRHQPEETGCSCKEVRQTSGAAGSWQRDRIGLCRVTYTMSGCMKGRRGYGCLRRVVHLTARSWNVNTGGPQCRLSAASPFQRLNWGMGQTACALCRVTPRARPKSTPGMYAACKGAEVSCAQCRGMWRKESASSGKSRGWPGVGLDKVTPTLLPPSQDS